MHSATAAGWPFASAAAVIRAPHGNASKSVRRILAANGYYFF